MYEDQLRLRSFNNLRLLLQFRWLNGAKFILKLCLEARMKKYSNGLCITVQGDKNNCKSNFLSVYSNAKAPLFDDKNIDTNKIHNREAVSNKI